jgi:hypothetical protein
MNRWRGLKDLIQDAVENGSRAIEEVHAQAGRWVFDLLERVPPLATPARLARSLQQAVIARTYETIRLVNRAVGGLVGVVIDAAAAEPRKGPAARGGRRSRR